MMPETDPMLSSQELRKLLIETDLGNVVSGYTELKSTSANSVLRGYCPLRADDSPLFFVLQSSQRYHCLGCSSSGNALDFLMQIERIDQVTAASRLQRFLRTRAPDGTLVHADPVLARTLKDVHEEATKFYAEQLRASAAALQYLDQRAVTEESMTHWRLGYAPDGWSAALGALKQYPIETLVAAGLAVARDGGGHYDRFRARLMFPIRDTEASVIAFGGRVLAEGEPKYLNSPESPMFRKGSQLYGQYESSRVTESGDCLWIVEGYMDVVALWQHGVRNCAATLGTSTTTQHVARLGKLTDNVLYCFDGDRAGRSAAWRAMESSLPALHPGHRIQFLLLPEGEDPDTLVRKIGAEGFHALARKQCRSQTTWADNWQAHSTLIPSMAAPTPSQSSCTSRSSD